MKDKDLIEKISSNMKQYAKMHKVRHQTYKVKSLGTMKRWEALDDITDVSAAAEYLKKFYSPR